MPGNGGKSVSLQNAAHSSEQAPKRSAPVSHQARERRLRMP
jgi:hypothetical protein